MGVRIGLFGGMFDPIHIGHCVLAEHCIEQARLHQCCLIPAHQSPLRERGGYATPYQRWMMTRIVARTNPKLRALDVEIRRKGISYTIDTIEQFQSQHPRAELFLVIGADHVVQFTRWHRWEDILQRVTLCVAPREEIDVESAIAELEQCGARILRIDMPRIGVSSSMIRDYCAAGKSIRYLVPEKVYRYIRKHHLYRHSDE